MPHADFDYIDDGKPPPHFVTINNGGGTYYYYNGDFILLGGSSEEVNMIADVIDHYCMLEASERDKIWGEYRKYVGGVTYHNLSVKTLGVEEKELLNFRDWLTSEEIL